MNVVDLASRVGPTEAELAAIEAEWPVYAAAVAVVDAECRFAASPDVLARRALRRAEMNLARAAVAHANTTRTSPNSPTQSQGETQ